MTLVKVGGPLSCFSMDPPGCDIPLAGQAGVAPSVPQARRLRCLPPASRPLPPPATATSLCPHGHFCTAGDFFTAIGATGGYGHRGHDIFAERHGHKLAPGRPKRRPSCAPAVPRGGTGEAQVTAPGTTDVTGVTGTATTAVPSSASTTVVSRPRRRLEVRSRPAGRRGPTGAVAATGRS